MKKTIFTDEQIIGFLKQAELGMHIKDIWRASGYSRPTFYKFCLFFGGIEVSDVAKLRDWSPRTQNASACWPKHTWISMRSRATSG
jgi:hypothetical protein